MDLNLLGILTANDNIHDQIDLFIKHIKSMLVSKIFPLTNKANICLYSYNLKENALLNAILYTFNKGNFHTTIKMSEAQYQQQRENAV